MDGSFCRKAPTPLGEELQIYDSVRFIGSVLLVCHTNVVTVWAQSPNVVSARMCSLGPEGFLVHRERTWSTPGNPTPRGAARPATAPNASHIICCTIRTRWVSRTRWQEEHASQQYGKGRPSSQTAQVHVLMHNYYSHSANPQASRTSSCPFLICTIVNESEARAGCDPGSI